MRDSAVTFAICISVLFCLISSSADANSTSNETSANSSAVAIEEVVVIGVRERLAQAGLLKDVIEKTEVIGAQRIEARHAANLTEAIADSPGVRVSNECSMCGVKRIMLNGMRGEHTTILTDGLPVHTMLSGYYAVDALAMTGVERIEVARGAGASLIAPEAIGGTINVITKEAYENSLEIDASGHADGGYQFGALGTLADDSGRTRATFIYQSDQEDQEDADGNGVSEAPKLENDSYIARLSHDITDRDNLTVRAAYIDSEIFGGPQEGDLVGGIDEVLAGFDGIESDQLFTDDDVRKRFVGKPWETTEWISTERTELSASWLHEFAPTFNSTLSVSYSDHEQDSFYEGFDYRADDELYYLDLRNNWQLFDDHLFTFGIDVRSEEMNSDSDAGSLSENYIEDSFDYDVTGIYLQDRWRASDQLEIALALRIDKVEADFTAPEKPGKEIDETVLAPRLDARYLHSDRWTSRLSVGRGYRAPLSFFESDHGILDAGDGFAIDIDDLEQSLSVSYTLSFEGDRLSSNASISYTEVENLSSIDETADGVPLLTQLDDDADVLAYDISIGYQLTDSLALSATLEGYDYDDDFKSSYAIAPIEQRAVFLVDYDYAGWQFNATASWTGDRNLRDYGYEGFNVLGDDTLKDTAAPDYWVVDMRIARDLGTHLTVYAGANNLFDYTQIEDEDTPLFWDPDGAYDVAYIYGPLRGREYYAGLKLTL